MKKWDKKGFKQYGQRVEEGQVFIILRGRILWMDLTLIYLHG